MSPQPESIYLSKVKVEKLQKKVCNMFKLAIKTPERH